MDWLPYYNDLKLAGHLACAFVATMTSGTLLYAVCLLYKQTELFARSYAFALWTSALMWVFPMFLDVSAQTREALYYASFVIATIMLKLVYNSTMKKTVILWIAFVVGEALVFLMIYKKVF